MRINVEAGAYLPDIAERTGVPLSRLAEAHSVAVAFGAPIRLSDFDITIHGETTTVLERKPTSRVEPDETTLFTREVFNGPIVDKDAAVEDLQQVQEEIRQLAQAGLPGRAEGRLIAQKTEKELFGGDVKQQVSAAEDIHRKRISLNTLKQFLPIGLRR